MVFVSQRRSQKSEKFCPKIAAKSFHFVTAIVKTAFPWLLNPAVITHRPQNAGVILG
jgi:hypothetical protein